MLSQHFLHRRTRQFYAAYFPLGRDARREHEDIRPSASFIDICLPGTLMERGRTKGMGWVRVQHLAKQSVRCTQYRGYDGGGYRFL